MAKFSCAPSFFSRSVEFDCIAVHTGYAEKEEIIEILKDLEGLSPSEISEKPIDLDKLKPISLKSLVLFANDHP